MSHAAQRKGRCWARCATEASLRPLNHLTSCISRCSLPHSWALASVDFTLLLKHMCFTSPQDLCTWHFLCLVQSYSCFRSSFPQGSIPPLHNGEVRNQNPCYTLFQGVSSVVLLAVVTLHLFGYNLMNSFPPRRLTVSAAEQRLPVFALVLSAWQGPVTKY